MTRLTPLDPSNATGRAKEILDSLAKRHGRAPNLTRVMAHSPSVLKAYVDFGAALAGGALPGRLRHQIAIAVGEANGCEYCVSAHTMIGKAMGLDDEELHRARLGRSSDVKSDAALRFARLVVDKRGDVEDGDVEALRSAGFGDGEIAEIVAHVAYSVFTNYLNLVARTPNDFPPVSRLPAARAGASAATR